MKRLIIVVLVLFLVPIGTLLAQEEESVEKWEPPVVDIGNMMIIYGSVNYSLSAVPYGAVGFGFDFQIGDNMVFSPTVKMIQNHVAAGTGYSGATSVEGGEINYLDINLSLKYFIQGKWWVSGGFVYGVFLNGYYIDNTGTATLFTSLSQTDEANKLGLKFATGLYAPIAEGVYMIPSGSVRINLPNSTDYSFSSSDIIFGIDFGIGVKM